MREETMIINLRDVYSEIIEKDIVIVSEKYKIKISQLINARDSNGNSLLYYAILDEELNVIKELVKYGACPLIYNHDGIQAFLLAAGTDNVDILDNLITEYKSSITEYEEAEMMAQAALNGLVNNIKCMTNKGLSCKGTYREDSIIMWGLQSENIEVIKLLHKEGASIDKKNEDGHTPIYNAAAEGLVDIVDYLVTNGADINVTSNEGDTPLMIACCYDQTEVVELLLKRGADLHYTNESGMDALAYAIQYGNCKVVKKILEFRSIKSTLDKINYYEFIDNIKDDEVKKEMKRILLDNY